MATIAEFIDSQISNPTIVNGSNLYSKIGSKISLFKSIVDNNGTLNPDSYSGIDALVCRRVLALYRKQFNDGIVEVKKALVTEYIPKVFSKIENDAYSITGFVSWAGNEALICPWLKEYITPDGPSSVNSSNPFTPSQSYQYTDFCKNIKFNSSSILTEQNKNITIDAFRVASFNKNDKKVYIGTPNKEAAFSSPGIDAQYIVDVSAHISAEYWCIGKLIVFDAYIVAQVFIFSSERELNCFEKPKYYTSVQSDGLGYTADAYLLFIPINGGTCLKIKNIISISQNKLDIINGYTDFIIHKNKLFCTKTISSDDIEFSGFRLGTEDNVKGYVKKTPPIKYKFKDCKFGLFELKIINNTVTETLVYNITVPIQSESKFAINGSKLIYTTIKLAANDLCSYTFYFQLFYELVLQLPYDYSMKFSGNPYWESGLGKHLRLSSNLDEIATNDVIAKDIKTIYGTSFLSSIVSITYGMISKIVGHLYLEVPLDMEDNYAVKTKHSPYADIIYETIGESKPGYSPLNSDWEVWHLGSNAAAIDLFVIWHLASGVLGTGDAKTNYIISDLELVQFSSKHPAANKLNDIKESGVSICQTVKDWLSNTYSDGTKWCYGLAKRPGAFSFPFEKRYAFFGGNRGTNNWAVSGYNSCQDTFLVTFAHEKVAINGARTDKTARPVLILGGIGTHPDPFGEMGVWGDQLTQSPLTVEVWAYDTIEGNKVSIFQHCNSDRQPIVYMQGNEIPLGTIGAYETAYIESESETKYGMYPLPQNGINVDENHHTIQHTGLVFNDFKLDPNDPFTIYYLLYMYIIDYDNDDAKYLTKNYILESRAYKLVPFHEGNYNGSSQFRLDAAKAMAYWWSKQVPAKSTDPIPWFGPSQLALNVKLQ